MAVITVGDLKNELDDMDNLLQIRAAGGDCNIQRLEENLVRSFSSKVLAMRVFRPGRVVMGDECRTARAVTSIARVLS